MPVDQPPKDHSEGTPLALRFLGSLTLIAAAIGVIAVVIEASENSGQGVASLTMSLSALAFGLILFGLAAIVQKASEIEEHLRPERGAELPPAPAPRIEPIEPRKPRWNPYKTL